MSNTVIRYIFLTIALLCVPLGLATRKFSNLPDWVSAHAGDAIWAAMVYFGIAFLLSKRSPILIFGLALSFCLLIETSQLVESGWFDVIRDNVVGRLIFGQGFLWIDLLRYLIGCGVGLIVHSGLLKTKK